jgi:TRAP-type transport system periplasmic protein
MHQDKMNAYFLARTGDHVPFHLYLTTPIDKPDLSGLTIRTTPVYRAFFDRLGANLVQTAPGEVYTALERGSIDGYGWPVQGILDLGWDEQTKYRVDPGFYQVDVNILVNLDVWNSLNDEQKGLLEEAAAWIEEKNADNLEINEVERQQAGRGGDRNHRVHRRGQGVLAEPGPGCRLEGDRKTSTRRPPTRCAPA